MRKLLLTVILGASLSGCATVPGGGSISDTVRQVQEYTRAACSFVPTVQVIIAIINARAGAAFDIVNQICAALNSPKGLVASKPTLLVNGKVIVIKGKYVR